MRLELTKAQYDAMVDAMTAEPGYKLTCNPHEGSTYQKGPYCLCQADGAYWLDLEDTPLDSRGHASGVGDHGKLGR